MATGRKDLSPTVYEIRIKGHLDEKWAEWFYDLILTHECDGTTVLRGPLPDQTALHSVLDRIRDMNLPLVSVSQIQPDSAAYKAENAGDESPAGASGGAHVD